MGELLEKLRHCSGLTIDGPLQHSGSGYQNTVFRSANDWLIRLGRTQADGQRLVEEGKLLERLVAAMSFQVPTPAFLQQSDVFPTGVMVYRRLAGVALDTAHPERLTRAIAEQLGAIIAKLHTFAPREEVRDAASEAWRVWLSEPREWLERALATRERSTFDAWLADIEVDAGMQRFSTCFIHGDLWFDHVLIDPLSGCITGIVDFGDAGWGDPAQDLATQFHMGPQFFERVLAVYAEFSTQPPDVLKSRIRRRWQLREFHGLWWAWKRNDRVEIDDALRKLRAGPVFGM